MRNGDYFKKAPSDVGFVKTNETIAQIGVDLIKKKGLGEPCEADTLSTICLCVFISRLVSLNTQKSPSRG